MTCKEFFASKEEGYRRKNIEEPNLETMQKVFEDTSIVKTSSLKENIPNVSIYGSYSFV